jgi:kynureninase
MTRPTRAASETGDPLLLTPGPLTTGKRVKEVMVHDWGSRDATFLKINTEVLTRLPEIVNGQGDYVTVPMQGSGTFAVEAMLTTFVPPDGHVLVLINGAYGQRAKKILDIARRKVTVHETPEDTPPDLAAVERMLKDDASITHIFTIHCETTSGILNPIGALGALAQKYRKGYLIDSMSAFGALPLDAKEIKPDAVAASSNKCIEGVPGLGFVIARNAVYRRRASGDDRHVVRIGEARHRRQRGQVRDLHQPREVRREARLDGALDVTWLGTVHADRDGRLLRILVFAAVDRDGRGALDVHGSSYAAAFNDFTPISSRISRIAASTPRMWSALSRPMQPMRKLSATVSLPG